MMKINLKINLKKYKMELLALNEKMTNKLLSFLSKM